MAYANTEGRVPVQIWITPEMRITMKQAARRAGLTMEQAGREAVAGWLEWTAHVELEASRKIVRQYEEGALARA